MPTLHAIIIGINDYPRRPLKGCINDANQIQQTLQDFCVHHNLTFNLKVLLNADATRKGITDAYAHFQQARAGDICVVYYSGHGYRIAADSRLWVDGDSFHEAIYTFDADSGGRGLANKELAYLLWKNTQHVDNLHLVEFFDCCNSGGITRAVGGDDTAVRTVPSEIRVLPQNEYLGVSQYHNNNGRLAAPVARRIQLAASTGKETAKELHINGQVKGAFTTALCATLRENNFSISYHDLLERSSAKVKNSISAIRKQYGEQTPQLDAERVERGLQALTGGSMSQAEKFGLWFSADDKMWRFEAGEIQNVSNNSEIFIEETGNIVNIGRALSNYSLLSLPTQYDKSKHYNAKVHAAFGKKIIVAFSTQVVDTQRKIFQAAYAKKYENSSSRFFELIEQEQFANFLIHYDGQNYYLTTRGDWYTPLFLRCGADSLEVFFEATEKVAKWFVVKDLDNKYSAITDKDISIEITRYTPLDGYVRSQKKRWQQGDVESCLFENINGIEKRPALGVNIQNNGNQDLWISALWLCADFAIEDNYIAANKELVAAGDSVRLTISDAQSSDNQRTEKVFIAFSNQLKKQKVLDATEFIKIFVSTDDIDVSSYVQTAPEVDLQRSRGGAAQSESPSIEPDNVAKPDWKTFDIELHLKLPDSTANFAGDDNNTSIAAHAISAPSGFVANINVGSVATEHTGARSANTAIATQKLDEASMKPYFLAEGMGMANAPSTISFTDIQNAEAIDRENTIKLQLSKNRAPDEFVVAMGFDAATGLYFPTGFENEAGELEIFTLPEPASTGQRSLKGAVTLFLKKIINPITQSTTTDELFKLRIPIIPEDLTKPTTYESDKEKIKAEIAKAKKIILFAHGIIGDTTDQVKVLRRMSKDFSYDLVLAFDYESLGTDIDEIARQYKAQLESVGLGAHHGKELHCVVHSMGGLIHRYFIEQDDGDKVVTQLIMLGTPNNGSEIAHVTTYATLGLVAAVNFTCAYFGAPAKVREVATFATKYVGTRAFNTLSQMNPEGDFIKKLNQNGMPDNVPYHIVAGDIFAIDAKLAGSGFFDRIIDKAERKFGQLVYKESNDIAVRIKSIKEVKKVATDCVFDIATDHMSYFIAPDSVNRLEQILAKINHTVGVKPIEPKPTATNPITPQPTTIQEANTLSFFQKLLKWIKSFF